MNYDEITHHILLDFYESFSKNPNSIDAFYKTNSKLIISYPNEPQKVSLSNRFESLPIGDHKIFRWNGQKNGDQIIGHASGYIKIKTEKNNENNNDAKDDNNNDTKDKDDNNNNNDDTNNDQFYQCNEMIVYMHSIQDQNIKYPYQILYHSIHLSNMDPPPQPEPKLEPKPEQNEKNQPEDKKEAEKASEPSKASPSTDPIKISEPAKPTPTTSKPPTAESKPPPPELKPAQTPANPKINEDKHPILVDNPNILIKSRTVLATNLPYNVAQSSIIPEFEIYGKITRYAVVKGRILIEFENPNSLMHALDDGNFYWKDRYIKIKQMEDQFN